MKKIIIDTDPGVDDAIALAFAIKANLPLEAICTIYGNVTVDDCTRNVCTILELAQADISIYQGVPKPLKGFGRRAQSHGDNGLGGFSLDSKKKPSDTTAGNYYQQILTDAEPNSVTIIAIGPTTNLGLIAQETPELLKKVEKVVVMGGVFNEPGNVTPYAEFNVYNDPIALQLLLDCVPNKVVLVPANICRQVTFTQNVFDQISDEKLSKGLTKISEVFIEYYTNDSEYGQFDGGVMYDLLAIALEVRQQLFQTRQECVRVETNSGSEYGRTIITDGPKNCTVVTGVDAEAVKELYVTVMNS